MKDKKLTLYALLVSAVLIILVGLYRHPSFRPMFHFTTQQNWTDFVVTVQNEPENEAQKLWEFREFYDRGTIFLQQYQNLETPTEIKDVYNIPPDFEPHTVFLSGKIKSIEGAVPINTDVFWSHEYLKEQGWEEHARSQSIQVLENNLKTRALIIAKFDIQEASMANGYLHFDLRDDETARQFENKKWVVISVVEI